MSYDSIDGYSSTIRSRGPSSRSLWPGGEVGAALAELIQLGLKTWRREQERGRKGKP
jgi:hypothetical protein